MDEILYKLSIFALPLLFAVTVHEAAHGWMAEKLGDSTARMLGRVTLNPLRHIDPVGTVVVPIAVYLLSGFIFGWAKPVPVNWNNLHNTRRDVALVSLAGPGANFLMALIWALLIYLGLWMFNSLEWVARPLIYMGVAGVLINAILMALNLLPVPPLDGGRVVYSLLPPKMAQVYSRLEPYGLFIVVLLLATGLLGMILWPLIGLTISILPATDIVTQLIPVILSPARS
ncbi:site-2 protease family protein [bacterium endosymbiont of Escarpia laminata]|nr:MAG: site-2 protease family protein [bacterium endosymbiont of Escarpia laminata]RLJ18439.1 MAG: site-2 protease family protein [bacterium endosymbiont of Escarpia laminata]